MPFDDIAGAVESTGCHFEGVHEVSDKQRQTRGKSRDKTMLN